MATINLACLALHDGSGTDALIARTLKHRCVRVFAEDPGSLDAAAMQSAGLHLGAIAQDTPSLVNGNTFLVFNDDASLAAAESACKAAGVPTLRV